MAEEAIPAEVLRWTKVDPQVFASSVHAHSKCVDGLLEYLLVDFDARSHFHAGRANHAHPAAAVSEVDHSQKSCGLRIAYAMAS